MEEPWKSQWEDMARVWGGWRGITATGWGTHLVGVLLKSSARVKAGRAGLSAPPGGMQTGTFGTSSAGRGALRTVRPATKEFGQPALVSTTGYPLTPAIAAVHPRLSGHADGVCIPARRVAMMPVFRHENTGIRAKD